MLFTPESPITDSGSERCEIQFAAEQFMPFPETIALLESWGYSLAMKLNRGRDSVFHVELSGECQVSAQESNKMAGS